MPGIRAGNGDNWIINNGTLTVAAMPTGNASVRGTIDEISVCVPFTRICATIQVGNKVLSASSPESGTAIGIDRGSGNDTIVNNGTITVTKTVEDVTTNGVAIRAAATIWWFSATGLLRLAASSSAPATHDSGSALKLGGALTFVGNHNFSAAAGVNAAVGKSKPEASGLVQLQFRW